MLQMNFFVFLWFFSEVKQSYQSTVRVLEVNAIRLGEHENFEQDLQREELILANIQNLEELEGSGDLDVISITKGAKIDVTGCKETVDSEICSNKGKCFDNKCLCDSLHFDVDNVAVAYRYSGRYCEECPYCRAQRCSNFLPCIECHTHQKNVTCDLFCQFYEYKIVDEVIADIEKDEKFCDIENINGCFFRFKYYYNAQNLVIVEYEKGVVCLDGFRMMIFTFWGVVAYIFAVALLVPVCCLTKEREVSRSRTSLSTRHDILRFNLYN